MLLIVRILNKQPRKGRKPTSRSFEASCPKMRREPNWFGSHEPGPPVPLDIQASTSDQHVDFTRKEREPVSTFDSSHSTLWMADHTPSLYLDRMQFFTSILIHTANLSHHSEIALQDVPRLKYALRLFVDNEEREMQRINNRTWAPAQRLYAPCFFDKFTR